MNAPRTVRTSTSPPRRPNPHTTLAKCLPCRSCAVEGHPNTFAYAAPKPEYLWFSDTREVVAIRATYKCHRGRHTFSLDRHGMRRIVRETATEWTLAR